MKAKLHFLLSVITVLMTLSTVNCSKGSDSSSSDPAVNPALYGTSCGANKLYSQWGCQPQCGQSSVYVANQCQPVQSGYGAGAYGGGYGGTGTGNAAICQGSFGPGMVSVQGQPLPKYSCSDCYGYYNGTCYQGDYAHQFYGQ